MSMKTKPEAEPAPKRERRTLSPKQWKELGERYLRDESAAHLAQEYDISASAIRGRFAKKTKTIKQIANQLASAELALDELELDEQKEARALAGEIRLVAKHLSRAARHNASVAERLSSMAAASAQLLDLDDPAQAEGLMKRILQLTEMSNRSSLLGIDMLKVAKPNSDGEDSDGGRKVILVHAPSTQI